MIQTQLLSCVFSFEEKGPLPVWAVLACAALQILGCSLCEVVLPCAPAVRPWSRGAGEVGAGCAGSSSRCARCVRGHLEAVPVQPQPWGYAAAQIPCFPMPWPQAPSSVCQGLLPVFESPVFYPNLFCILVVFLSSPFPSVPLWCHLFSRWGGSISGHLH